MDPLFFSSREALILVDSALTLHSINAAAEQLLGRPARELAGRPVRDVLQLERELSRGWRQNPLLAALERDDEPELGEDSRLVCGGRRIPVCGKVLPVRDGHRRYALLCLQPSAPRVEAPSLQGGGESELLLQHLSRLNTVSELATGIAHEMNQPLAAIMSFNQAAMRLLADDEPDIERACEALAEAVSQTRRAAGILERLRAFVGRRGLQFEPVAINQVVVNAITLLSSKISASGVRVRLNTEPCPPVQADALQLEQVMVNLVRNAVEAMQAVPVEGRILHVGTQAVAGRVHVRVSDSGPGLPAALREQLFTRFFTTKADGMGLGLSISRTILEAAGGDLSAANQPGGGACFHFSLPVLTTKDIRHGTTPA
jgi:signal transduction histidine kinase